MTTDIVKGERVIRLSEKHRGYSRDMTAHFEIYFNAIEPREENGLLVADFSAPSLHRYRHNGLEFMLSSIPEEPETLEAYFKHVQGTKLAFDVGAYCGLSTYEASRSFDQVIAFEPDEQNRLCLLSNIERHKMMNVRVVPAAMTASTGKTQFFAEGSLGSRLALPEYRRGPIVEVETISLSDACALYGVPDFISMDIEAAEIGVLDSSRELLTRELISFAIDTNHEEAAGWTFGAVESTLRSCGYCVETGTPGGFYTTWGWKEDLIMNGEEATMHLGRASVAS